MYCSWAESVNQAEIYHRPPVISRCKWRRRWCATIQLLWVTVTKSIISLLLVLISMLTLYVSQYSYYFYFRFIHCISITFLWYILYTFIQSVIEVIQSYLVLSIESLIIKTTHFSPQLRRSAEECRWWLIRVQIPRHVTIRETALHRVKNNSHMSVGEHYLILITNMLQDRSGKHRL